MGLFLLGLIVGIMGGAVLVIGLAAIHFAGQHGGPDDTDQAGA